jgi:hypothetical protein
LVSVIVFLVLASLVSGGGTRRNEERLTALEEKLSRLTEREAETTPKAPWWKRIVGVYKDDPEFDEAERLGRERRESLLPKADEDAT